MLTRIAHPDTFTDGTRVLLLKARHKDGTIGKERAIQRVTHSSDDFRGKLTELYEMMRPGERIYATATPRCLKKAARLFGERMNTALHDPEPVRMHFYAELPNRWYSCLMKPESGLSGEHRRWMWDCDDADTYKRVRAFAQSMDGFYEYQTKNGHHILVKPYPSYTTPPDIAHPDHNPLILWGYTNV